VLNPRAGSKTDEPGVYRWPLGKHRYTIFYRLRAENDGIEIVRGCMGSA
jgi:plasmid stabilization system protein ParE